MIVILMSSPRQELRGSGVFTNQTGLAELGWSPCRLTVATPQAITMNKAPEPRIVKLPPNGPKPGQSTEAWLRGKDRNCQRERDDAFWSKKKK